MSRTMYTVIRCDRCGAEVRLDRSTNVRNFTHTHGDTRWGAVDEIDLCPACNEQYTEMMRKFMARGSAAMQELPMGFEVREGRR